MSSVIPFNFKDCNIRVIQGDDGEPWFVSSDVCQAMGIANYRDATGRLDDDEKGVGTADTLGGQQEVLIVNESGLYSLTMTSRKPEAKVFRKWVTSEVLPSIRKTGSYQLEDQAEDKSVRQLIDANRLFKSNLSVAEIVFKGNQALLSANMATRQATKVDVLGNIGATHLLSSDNDALMTASDIGKQIGLSAQKVNALLEESGFIASFRDSKNRKQYELTGDGEQFAETLDTGKKHGDGTPVKQIKWRSRVVTVLEDFRAARVAA